MPGNIVHFEVPADDASRALTFYGAMFGWSFGAMEGPIEYHLAEVSEGLGGAVHRVDQSGGIPGIYVYFDIEAHYPHHAAPESGCRPRRRWRSHHRSDPRRAHEGCFVANTLNAEMVLEPEVEFADFVETAAE